MWFVPTFWNVRTELTTWCTNPRESHHVSCNGWMDVQLLTWESKYGQQSVPKNCPLTFFLIIKPTRCTNFSNLFWNETLHVSDSSSVHHQEFFTVHPAIVYVIQDCWQFISRIRMVYFDPARKLSAKLYDIYHCCVYSEKLLMMDRGTVRNM